ncbi:hypothetical protein [Sphaerimonospora mesophila]|uniref:hypothetical protein n=1 Tax=Sphaerimonospora mesophila TaxID=37483 RepID=UPI00128EA2E1
MLSIDRGRPMNLRAAWATTDGVNLSADITQTTPGLDASPWTGTLSVEWRYIVPGEDVGRPLGRLTPDIVKRTLKDKFGSYEVVSVDLELGRDDGARLRTLHQHPRARKARYGRPPVSHEMLEIDCLLGGRVVYVLIEQASIPHPSEFRARHNGLAEP